MSEYNLNDPEPKAVDDGQGAAVAKPKGGEPKPAQNEPDGKGGGWVSVFPKDYQEKYADQLKGFAKPKDLLDAYLANSEKLKGAIIKPGENATDEERKAYLKALGVPDKYTLPEVSKEDKGYLEGLDVYNKFFKETAAKIGLTQEQAETFYKLYIGANVQRTKDALAARERTIKERADALDREWGDKTPERFELAKRAFKKYATPEFVEAVKAKDLETDPSFIKVFYEISQKIGGDRGTSSTPGTPQAEEHKGLNYDVLNDRYPPTN